MKTIKYSIPTGAPQKILIPSKHVPDGIDVDEHCFLEDNSTHALVTVTAIFSNGDILVNLKSYGEHPSITLQKGITLFQKKEQSFVHDQIRFQFERALNDWQDGLINTRALETVSRIARAFLTEESNKQTNNDTQT